MYCTKCGALIDENILICSKCGEVHNEVADKKESELQKFNESTDDVSSKK